MKSILKIDFNTNAKIILAVLKRFRGHKTKASSIKYDSQSTAALLNILKFISRFNNRRR